MVPPAATERGNHSAWSLAEVRRSIAEQMAPVLAVHAALGRRWSLAIDVAHARGRIDAGLVAYHALDVIRGAGDLDGGFARATKGLERAGLASPAELAALREKRWDVPTLLAGWLSGEAVPTEPSRSLARRAAIVVGNSIPHEATATIMGGHALALWPYPFCPCCGGTPDFSFSGDDTRRLLCARCDALWRTPLSGCLGCGATAEPTIARIASPAIGYMLTVCNACGRYVKETEGGGDVNPVVERALTGKLDRAAERRGLRL